MKAGKFNVVTEARVTTIEVNGNGHVTGVTYIKDGTEYFQPADAVLVGSYIYENVRLLLLSKSQPFPNGLSNNHGQVGKHYFSHNQGGAVSALFPFNLNNWYGTPGQGVAIDNWADDNFDHSAWTSLAAGIYTSTLNGGRLPRLTAYRPGCKAVRTGARDGKPS